MQQIPFERILQLIETKEPLNIELALNVAKWHHSEEFKECFGYSVEHYEQCECKPALEQKKTLLEITKIINNKNAILSTDGHLVFEAVKSEIEKGNKVLLSFSGLEICTHTFISESIGKLYMYLDNQILNQYFECFGSGIHMPYWREVMNKHIIIAENIKKNRTT